MKIKWVATVLVWALAGCATQPARPVPDAISGDEQVQQLNARATLVQSLKGRGRVSMEWKDEKGNHRETADALLLMRRIAQSRPEGTGAEVVLMGSFSGSEMFEMGVNAAQHWIAFLVEPKKAYVGQPLPAGTPQMSAAGGGRAPFRADRVMEVLGLVKLIPGPMVRMRVLPETNEVEVWRPGLTGPAWLERTQVIDRRAGDLTAVRFYFPDGRLEATATLGDYHEFKGANDGLPAGAVRLPYQVHVEYPGREAQVDLVIRTLKVNSELPADFAAMPDFAKQGLEVVDEGK